MWLTTQQAAYILGVSPDLLYERRIYNSIRTRAKTGKSTRGAGRVWMQEDVKRLREIMRQCEVGAAPAARVFGALREGRI